MSNSPLGAVTASYVSPYARRSARADSGRSSRDNATLDRFDLSFISRFLPRTPHHLRNWRIDRSERANHNEESHRAPPTSGLCRCDLVSKVGAVCELRIPSSFRLQLAQMPISS